MTTIILAGIAELVITAIVMAMVVSAPEPQDPVYDEDKQHSGLLEEE